VDPEPLIFNGIDGATGQYLLPPLTPRDISKIAQGEKLDPAHLHDLMERWTQASQPHFGVKALATGDETNLARTGWGVVFAHDADPAIREALAPLLDRRQVQAGAENEKYYQEYIGVRAYRPEESKQQFLARNGAAPGPADPNKVPYYLLLVGDPEAIPFRFQYQLDVQYSVGRIHFDTLEEYAQYASNVVETERNPPKRERRAAFFGVRNAGDQATQLSADHLVKPLAAKLASELAGWKCDTVLADDATKARLGQLLGGADTPAFLFSASHGMGFPNGDPRQAAEQGALLCQDWPGPIQWRQPIPPEFYFAGEDLGDSTALKGTVAFFFACYGAGTPRLDDFAHAATGAQSEIAPHGFLGQLPKRLLTRGMLAVVGHVERAWGCSFMWKRTREQISVFESSLLRLLQGEPIGRAMEFFNERYAELSSDLTSELEEVKYGKIADDVEISGMWTANNDARSYIIIGDPAVCLAAEPSTTVS
jgi:hypothetical protein